MWENSERPLPCVSLRDFLAHFERLACQLGRFVNRWQRRRRQGQVCCMIMCRTHFLVTTWNEFWIRSQTPTTTSRSTLLRWKGRKATCLHGVNRAALDEERTRSDIFRSHLVGARRTSESSLLCLLPKVAKKMPSTKSPRCMSLFRFNREDEIAFCFEVVRTVRRKALLERV